ncbi:MAG: hypothetical protein JSR96_03110 [Proteobacteria bacterium]|nr:hypothetical protein [Pseudomonadota bacterium]
MQPVLESIARIQDIILAMLRQIDDHIYEDDFFQRIAESRFKMNDLACQIFAYAYQNATSFPSFQHQEAFCRNLETSCRVMLQHQAKWPREAIFNDVEGYQAESHATAAKALMWIGKLRDELNEEGLAVVVSTRGSGP